MLCLHYITRYLRCTHIGLLLLLCVAHVEAADFADRVQELKKGSYRAKAAVVAELVKQEHPRLRAILTAMLDKQLYFRKADEVLIIIQKSDAGISQQDAISGVDLGLIDKAAIKRIKTNSTLRKRIGQALAILNLAQDDTDVRLQAMEDLMDGMTPFAAERVHSYLQKEQSKDVRQAMQAALAIAELEDSDIEIVLAAIKKLSGNIHPKVRGALQQAKDRHADLGVHAAIDSALQSIQAKLDFFALLEKIFFGLSLGSILALAAIGLAITFGVMGVINMAHGELIMLGAYTTYGIQLLLPNHIELSLLIAIPAAFMVSGLVGVAIERGIIQFLYGRPLETLLATFGVSLILQQSVRTFVSAQNVAVETPQWLSGSWHINSVLSFTYNRLYIFVFALVVFVGLVLLLKRTALGLQVRAVSQNRAMAKAVGIRTEWVDALTFGLGSGIAGIAGVALSQLTNVGPNMGQQYIIDSFMVVVFGGVGNLWGTLLSGLTLGVGNKFLEPVAGAVLAKILILVFIILFIQKRPRGLFPQKGRAAEN